ncbi:MAG: hypothetical protein II399_02455, partial [Lachnospiraceae bacterium]|nr:hypothetical protein [Lachnospiraceae bacterium]
MGQTPIVALADGNDTRVISVPEGLQELLVNESPEVQTVQIENTTEDSIEIPNEVIDETNETTSEPGEVIDENNEFGAETNETPSEQSGEVISSTDETPIAQTADTIEETTESNNATDENNPEVTGETIENAVIETQVSQDENNLTSQDVQGEETVSDASTDTVIEEENTETNLTATIVASDGNTYETNVTYKSTSGIPSEGTMLQVIEIEPGDEGHDEYIDESIDKIGAKAEDVSFSKVFDIKIVDENDNNIVYEPTGDVDVSIRVIGMSLSDYPNVNVIHFIE